MSGKGQAVGPVRGKAYTPTVDQANASGEIIAGIILVHSILAFVLFDSGATHCFISSKFISKHDISCDTVTGVGQLALGMGKCRVIRCVRDAP